MGFHSKLLQITLPGVVIIAIAVMAAPPPPPVNQKCPDKCGNLSIPYPFGGEEEGCYLNKSFMVTCHNGTPKLGNVPVEVISLETHELRALQIMVQNCSDQSGQQPSDSLHLEAPPFTISGRKNKFTVVGCNTSGFLRGIQHGREYVFGCTSGCPSNISNVVNGSCPSGCCQVDIPDGLTGVSVQVQNSYNGASDFSHCGYAFPVKKEEFNFSSVYLRHPPNKTVPVVFQWAVGFETCEKVRKNICHPGTAHCENGPGGLGYRCICNRSYEGNPYLGCQEKACPPGFKRKGKTHPRPCVLSPAITAAISIGSGVTVAVTLSVSLRLYLVHKKRNKEKCFTENGGLILEGREQTDQAGSKGKAEIFSIEKLKNATKNFHESSIIGHGGFGISYKGILPDKRIVAIKKSYTVNKSQEEQFIDEVVVLSKINHRNIVKLLGCCLETKIPLLVYEFISDHTLFEYICRGSKLSPLQWETRIKIATEVAEALSYLHSKPITHRDVKSANILLTDDVTPKVSNFGISRLVPLDQGKLVQGTPGYLDPEYLQTNQLSKKSDVYGFGVVLIELLIREDAFSLDRSEEKRSLVMNFLSYLKEEQILDVIDNNIVEEGNEEQIKEAVELANRCIRVNGDERPTMEEVVAELERMRKMIANPSDNPQPIEQESEQLPGETSETYEDDKNGDETI